MTFALIDPFRCIMCPSIEINVKCIKTVVNAENLSCLTVDTLEYKLNEKVKFSEEKCT